jgi:hypothetical protein
MRNVVALSIAALALLALSPFVMAQTMPAGWLPCPRCQSAQDRAQARVKARGKPCIQSRDISGVWGVTASS